MLRTIVWNLDALRQFEDALAFIEQDFPDNANKVRRNLFLKIDQLLLHPDMHLPDKFKISNKGSFRAFELYHYRVSYYVSEKQIRIIRVRHSSMKQKKY